MSTYQRVLARTSAVIISVIAESTFALSWERGSEQVLAPSSWHVITTSELDRADNSPQPKAAMDLAAQASAFAKRGNYSEAERLLKTSLEITSQALGPGHPQIAKLLIKLGSLYAVQRRYAEAEGLLRHSLEINEKALGPDHLDVAANLEALAFVLKKQHLEEEAREVQTRAFKIWSKRRDPRSLHRSGHSPG